MLASVLDCFIYTFYMHFCVCVFVYVYSRYYDLNYFKIFDHISETETQKNKNFGMIKNK